MMGGKLRNFIDIQAPVRSKDSFGSVTTVWESYRKLWASIETLKGKEREAAKATYPEADVKVICRYVDGILPTMRIVFRDTVYSIVSPPNNVEMRNRELQITCKAGVALS